LSNCFKIAPKSELAAAVVAGAAVVVAGASVVSDCAWADAVENLNYN
jgi:hypothetical protein